MHNDSQFLPGSQRQDKSKWPQAAPGQVQAGHQEQSLRQKGCQALAWAAKGSDGIIIPGSAQEMTLRGTYGVVEKVMLSQKLDSVILEVFSHLNGCVIPSLTQKVQSLTAVAD